jgi:hypothetical protein
MLLLRLRIRLLTLLGLIVVFADCNKDKNNEDQWNFCSQCTVGSWTGEFSGTGNYNNLINHETAQSIPVSVVIEGAEFDPDYLTVYFQSPDYMSLTVSGNFQTAYNISFAGSGTSVTATLYTNGSNLRMSGNAKKFHYKVDSLVTDEIINFEAFKDSAAIELKGDPTWIKNHLSGTTSE